jgi:serine protease Do
MKIMKFLFGFSFMAFIGLVIFLLSRLYDRQQELESALLQHATNQVTVATPLPSGAALQPAVSNWVHLQEKVRDSVVQVFAQVAAIDLLQPYKTPNQGQGTGSGFFINETGEIITNAHVIDQAKAVWIQIPSLGKQQIDVDIVGVCPERDIALLKLRPEGMQLVKDTLGKIEFLELGDSDFIHRAQEIMALGYPLGMQGLKSTMGVVSGREQHLIQIDVSINPGNSGGPSLNHEGKVIGINSYYGGQEAQTVGYIIPINELKIVLADLRVVSLLRKPFLGVLFNNASESLTRFLGNPLPGGLYVVDVYKDSPLHKAGVQKGDMMYAINNNPIDVYGELAWHGEKISIIDYVAQLRRGQEVNLLVYRKGERKEISLAFNQCELLPVRRIYPGYETIDYEIVGGMVIQQLTQNHIPLLINIMPNLIKYTEMKNQMEPALIITHIFPDSQAQRSRSLLPGAIISEINGEKVKTLEQLRNVLIKSITTGDLTVETADGVFVVCPFKKVLEENLKLAADYYFPVSFTMRDLMARMDKKSGETYFTEQMLLADQRYLQISGQASVAAA